MLSDSRNLEAWKRSEGCPGCRPDCTTGGRHRTSVFSEYFSACWSACEPLSFRRHSGRWVWMCSWSSSLDPSSLRTHHVGTQRPSAPYPDPHRPRPQHGVSGLHTRSPPDPPMGPRQAEATLLNALSRRVPATAAPLLLAVPRSHQHPASGVTP